MAYPTDKPELFPQPSLDDLIGEAGEILAKAKERFRPVATFALFSGGNDSTAAFDVVKDHVDAAVHIVTGIGIMEKGRTALDHVKRVCKKAGVPLIVLRTDPDQYRDIIFNAKAEGFPGPAFHYVCYHRLKQKRIRTLQRDHSQCGEKILLVSGIRRSESRRRKRKFKKPVNQDHEARRCWWVNPILGWDSQALLTYRQKQGLPQCEGAALIHKSGECLCGAMAKANELPEIEFWFPETGKYIRSLEREAEKAGKPYCRWGWGHDKLAGVTAPGPLCSSCELFKHMGEKDAG